MITIEFVKLKTCQTKNRYDKQSQYNQDFRRFRYIDRIYSMTNSKSQKLSLGGDTDP